MSALYMTGNKAALSPEQHPIKVSGNSEQLKVDRLKAKDCKGHKTQGRKMQVSKDVGVARREIQVPQFGLLVSRRTALASRRGWRLETNGE